MKQQTPFYLISKETYSPFGPIKCYIIGRLLGRNYGDDYLLVKIEPAIIGQSFGLGDKDISEVVLATRYADTTLHPISEWPMIVFVSRITNPAIIDSGQAKTTDLEVILIGELYPTLSDAQNRVNSDQLD